MEKNGVTAKILKVDLYEGMNEKHIMCSADAMLKPERTRWEVSAAYPPRGPGHTTCRLIQN